MYYFRLLCSIFSHSYHYFLHLLFFLVTLIDPVQHSSMFSFWRLSVFSQFWLSHAFLFLFSCSFSPQIWCMLWPFGLLYVSYCPAPPNLFLSLTDVISIFFPIQDNHHQHHPYRRHYQHYQVGVFSRSGDPNLAPQMSTPSRFEQILKIPKLPNLSNNQFPAAPKLKNPRGPIQYLNSSNPWIWGE